MLAGGRMPSGGASTGGAASELGRTVDCGTLVEEGRAVGAGSNVGLGRTVDCGTLVEEGRAVGAGSNVGLAGDDAGDDDEGSSCDAAHPTRTEARAPTSAKLWRRANMPERYHGGTAARLRHETSQPRKSIEFIRPVTRHGRFGIGPRMTLVDGSRHGGDDLATRAHRGAGDHSCGVDVVPVQEMTGQPTAVESRWPVAPTAATSRRHSCNPSRSRA